jgi:hypothetical protein
MAALRTMTAAGFFPETTIGKEALDDDQKGNEESGIDLQV